MMRRLVLAALLPLAACASAGDSTSTAGTAATFSGSICGQQAEFTLADLKDRSQATLTATCPPTPDGRDGGSVSFSSADSSASAVIQAQIQLAQQLGQLATNLAMLAAGLPPVPALHPEVE